MKFKDQIYASPVIQTPKLLDGVHSEVVVCTAFSLLFHVYTEP